MSGPGQKTPSNPTGQGGGLGTTFLNLSTLVTGVQDAVKAIFTLQQIGTEANVDLDAIATEAVTANTRLASINTSLGTINTTLGTINTTISTVFPLDTHSGAKTYDAASIPDGDSLSTTVTVTGASLGDFAVASFSLDTQGMTVSATVTAADTATVVFFNNTGGAIDLASGNLRVRTFS